MGDNFDDLLHDYEIKLRDYTRHLGIEKAKVLLSEMRNKVLGPTRAGDEKLNRLWEVEHRILREVEGDEETSDEQMEAGGDN